jgi:hypothetical protein
MSPDLTVWLSPLLVFPSPSPRRVPCTCALGQWDLQSSPCPGWACTASRSCECGSSWDQAQPLVTGGLPCFWEDGDSGFRMKCPPVTAWWGLNYLPHESSLMSLSSLPMASAAQGCEGSGQGWNEACGHEPDLSPYSNLNVPQATNRHHALTRPSSGCGHGTGPMWAHRSLNTWLSVVVHTCNPSYVRGRDGRISVWGQARQKLARPYFKKQAWYGGTCL